MYVGAEHGKDTQDLYAELKLGDDLWYHRTDTKQCAGKFLKWSGLQFTSMVQQFMLKREMIEFSVKDDNDGLGMEDRLVGKLLISGVSTLDTMNNWKVLLFIYYLFIIYLFIYYLFIYYSI
jgi:hypothetical protein